MKSIIIAAILILVNVGFSFGQEQQFAPDPIEQLRLTPDQRQSVRLIMQELQSERQAANRRVREAHVALDQALDAESIDENLIEQRINELTTAQAAQMRLRIRTELKIRRVLHPEQLTTLRRLRLQVRDVMNPQRRNQRLMRPSNLPPRRPQP